MRIRRVTTETLAKSRPSLSAAFARVTSMPILLLGLIVLAACGPATHAPPRPTPTVYHPPVTPTISRPPTLPPSARSQPEPVAEPTTVLLLGIDRRSLNDGLNNTDTMMLFHLDPNGQRVAVLSIPRDLYVEIPGYGQDRINTAYAYGKVAGTGGLALACQTVSATLGVPVKHAVLIDFEVFVTLIDAIGGLDVDVPYDISDPTYPDSGIGYDPFYLPAGQYRLDGATALKYVRTRATPGGDFTRTARQRQVVLAVRDRVLRFDLLPSLIAQSPQLWSALQGAFETELTLGEIVDLAVIAGRTPADQVATAAIDETCTYPWVTPDGASVLVPNQAAIEALVADLFSSPSAAALPH